MKSSNAKTNAMRILDSMGIAYEILTYDWDEDHLDAVHAAQAMGVDESLVCKTIVMRDQDNRICVFVLPATLEISLKKARCATSSKSIELVRVSELRSLTGYVRGGCSPLGMTKVHPMFLEETLQLYDKIYVSAGQRGVQLHIAVADLVRAAGAVFADIV